MYNIYICNCNSVEEGFSNKFDLVFLSNQKAIMNHLEGVVKPIPLLLLYFLWTLLSNLSLADPPYPRCSNTSNYTENSLFQNNLQNLLGTFPSNASTLKFHSAIIGKKDADKVYGLYMCLSYVNDTLCHDCIATAAQDVLGLCHNSKEAVVWEESCQLRYSNENFFGKLSVTGNIPLDNVQNISQPEEFKSFMKKTLRNLTQVAASNDSSMYATGEVAYMDKTVYALVQCTGDLSSDDCKKCLGSATEEILDVYYHSIGARLLSRSCYLRYELYAFYSESGSMAINTNGEDNGRKRWKFALVAVVISCLVVVVLGSYACYYALNRRHKKRNNENRRKISHMNIHGDDSTAQEFPYIDLASIKIATNNFSDSNKLGEGGFGPVYKGALRDGKEVAVKRLSICSEQDGKEKILVYEYLPNSSLDIILFDSRKRAQLDWSTRVKIVNGIARGTLYLHEDSRLRIIHRDLKASNILLDLNMNPKISDFGMARIFAGTESQANTATIVGTYGYMAPEYAMEGLYSVKSDVFSFGVLLLEIITGKRNAGFHLTKLAPCLLSYTWQLWQGGQALELVDPLVVDSYDQDEFMRYLQIGLLCVQKDANDRPTMSSVVVMLKGESTASNSTLSLCKPKQPAFSMGRFTAHRQPLVDTCSVNGVTVSSLMPR
ncbi:cysteine-rich receptor-like protein kinase 10 isoform X2 [Humulus lupulus]|uniref:cysteine-rich receptor-like protein kinase 10 isoform X2 n=1 Tax=Humulus lupulus TaxID=3486 RepID=UPI002B40FD70|nr:cysteine-rich receptor-like protein kinase 10 isoform X2 [Humulus lupulus]